MVFVILVLLIGVVFSAKIIKYKKLGVITFSIMNNTLLVMAVLSFAMGVLMATTNAFIAASDLSVCTVLAPPTCCSQRGQ